MRKREEGHEHLEKLQENERPSCSDMTPQEQILDGDLSSVSHIWQTMVQVKEDMTSQGKLQHYLCEMLDQFVNDSVDLNHQLSYEGRKVSNLENKLGSIHTIDFKAQTDSQTLRKELLDLKQKCLEDQRNYQEELGLLQQSLEEKSNIEKNLTDEVNSMKKKFNQTLSETKSVVGANKSSTKHLEK